MFNQIFRHRINYLQNRVPLGNFWARGAKCGYMTKNLYHVLAIVIRIFSNHPPIYPLENLQNPSANDVHLSNNLLILTALAVKCLYTGFNFQSLVVISF